MERVRKLLAKKEEELENEQLVKEFDFGRVMAMNNPELFYIIGEIMISCEIIKFKTYEFQAK